MGVHHVVFLPASRTPCLLACLLGVWAPERTLARRPTPSARVCRVHPVLGPMPSSPECSLSNPPERTPAKPMTDVKPPVGLTQVIHRHAKESVQCEDTSLSLSLSLTRTRVDHAAKKQVVMSLFDTTKPPKA